MTILKCFNGPEDGEQYALAQHRKRPSSDLKPAELVFYGTEAGHPVARRYVRFDMVEENGDLVHRYYYCGCAEVGSAVHVPRDRE